MKSNTQQKIIHIHAKCDAFEFYEQIPENKAVQRLNTIKRNFLWSAQRSDKTDSLSVKTRVVNPELQFY